MDEADEILLSTLKEIGWEEGNSKGIKDLTPEDVVSATVYCLKAINFPCEVSPNLPPNMATRYKLCSTLAEHCQASGYNGEIGYQTFLYGSEHEIRHLFTFLISLLSKLRAKPETDLGSEGSIRSDISSMLIKCANFPWLPSFCKPNGLRKVDDDTWLLEGGSSVIPCTVEHSKITSTLTPLNLMASLLEMNSLYCAQEKSKEQYLDGRAKKNINKLRCKKNFQEWLKRDLSECDIKCEVAVPKPTMEDSKVKVNAEIEGIDKRLSFPINITNPTKNIVDELKENLKVSKSKNASLQKKVIKAESALIEMKDGIASERESIKAIESNLELLLQMCDYVEKNENPERKVKEDIQIMVDKLKHMALKWEKHRCGLIEQYRVIKEQSDNQTNSSKYIMREIENINREIEHINEEISLKDSNKTDLLKQLNKLPKDINRSSYTDKILDIINNINKQKIQIENIIEDIKVVQKEINSLEGKLLRAFNLADEVIFKDCKKDESARQAYKHLATCQETCDKIIISTKESGNIGKEIMDLEYTIETETQKGVTENLERILADCKQMKLENQSLLSKLSMESIS